MKSLPCVWSFVLLALSAPAAPLSHPAFWRYVHPDAKILIGVDVNALTRSPLWSSLAADFERAGWKQEISASGLDFLEHVERVLLSAPGFETQQLDWDQAPVVLALHGRFPLDQLKSTLTARGARASTYQGIPLLEQDGAKTDLLLALVSPQLLLLGDSLSLRAAIDHQLAGSPSLPSSPLFQRATELAVLYDVWITSTITPPARLAAGVAPAPLLEQIRALEGGISFRDGVSLALSLETPSPATARELTEGLNVLLQFGAMAPKPDPFITGLLSRLRISHDHERAQFAVAWNQLEVAQLLTAARDNFFQAAFHALVPAPSRPAEPTLPVPPPPPTPLVVKVHGLDDGPKEIVFRP
jgi:hypothetical protein